MKQSVFQSASSNQNPCMPNESGVCLWFYLKLYQLFDLEHLLFSVGVASSLDIGSKMLPNGHLPLKDFGICAQLKDYTCQLLSQEDCPHVPVTAEVQDGSYVAKRRYQRGFQKRYVIQAHGRRIEPFPSSPFLLSEIGVVSEHPHIV